MKDDGREIGSARIVILYLVLSQFDRKDCVLRKCPLVLGVCFS